MTPAEEELGILDKLAVDKVGEEYADAFKVGYLRQWVLNLEYQLEKFKARLEAEVERVERYNPYLADEREEGMRL